MVYGELRQHLREVFRQLAEESRMEERHPLPEQVHMMITIPPKSRARK